MFYVAVLTPKVLLLLVWPLPLSLATTSGISFDFSSSRYLDVSVPGVLFTFPSQYCSTIGHQVVFRLGGWAPRLLTGFLVSADTLDTATLRSCFAYGTITPYGPFFHTVPLHFLLRYRSPYPGSISTPGLASSAFARRY